MSESHIPQPASGMAPAEQIQSTDGTPPMTSIETTAPTPPDILPALGEDNAIDPYFYRQLVRLDTVQWSVNDETGKLLWYIPIAPQYLHRNLAYISRMYYAWIGDFEFTFKVAGTGFHAGLVTLFATPPGIHPTTVTSPQDFTYFPWDATDPKTLQIGAVLGRDKRKVKYHRVVPASDEPDENAIGGYLGLAVDMPLSTSASGVPRINIAIWVRCMPSFKFSYMLPYDLQDVKPSSVMPEPLAVALNFTNYKLPQIMSSNFEWAQQIVFKSESLKQLNTGIYNTVTLEGRLNSTYNTHNRLEPPIWGFKDLVVVAVAGDEVVLDLPIPYPQINPKDDSLGGLVISTDGKKFFKFTEIHTKDTSVTVKVPGHDFAEKDIVFITWYSPLNGENSRESEAVDNSLEALTSSESFVVFSGSRTIVYSIQTVAMTNYLSTGALSTWMPYGKAALLQMVETNTALPVAQLKLYRRGFFTTRAVKDEKVFDLTKFHLRFVSFINETAEIPTNPEFNKNMMMYFVSEFAQASSTKSSAKSKLKSLRSRN